MADTALWQSGFLELLKRRQKRRSFLVSTREGCCFSFEIRTIVECVCEQDAEGFMKNTPSECAERTP